MSTTPRTDEAARQGCYLTAGDYASTCGKQIVHIDFARQLETELNEAKSQLAESQAREAQLREALERISNAKFSWDGDCGVVSMAQEALNSFTSKHPTL